jgi:hypothetical protein
VSKANAPVDLTGGAGFRLEDQVAGLYLASMLAGTHPGGTDLGVVHRVAWQTSDAGWKLDDLAVELRRPQPGTLAVSVKSERQVTRGGFPPSFVEAAWAQLEDAAPGNPFRAGRDLLALGVGKLAAGVHAAWHGLLREGRLNPPERIAGRYSKKDVSDQIGRSLLASLSPPGTEDLLKAARLMPHLRLFHFDFGDTGSRSESLALWTCQHALRSGDLGETQSLWRAIVDLAAEHRSVGGSLDAAGVVARIRDDFELKDRPDYAAQWAILDARSKELASQIGDSVGGGVCLVREAPINALRAQVAEGRAVVIAGEGGSGKSSVAKRLATTPTAFERYLWLDASALDFPTLSECGRHLGIGVPLVDLLRLSAPSSSCLVVDGFENFSSRAAARVQDLVAVLGPLPSARGWTLVVTTRPQLTGEARHALLTAGVQADAVATRYLELPSDREVDLLLGAMAGVNPSLVRRELRGSLRNLKLFDWVAHGIAGLREEEVRSWVGTTQVIDALWSRWVGSGATSTSRAGVMKKLARLEGDGLEHGIGTSRLEVSEHAVLGELEERELVRVREERVWFRHDMLGDWSRLRQLIEVASDPAAVVSLASHPRWHDAIRLYGQRLLETDPAAPERWSALVAEIAGTDTPSVVARDILLESLFVTPDSEGLLEKAWPSLSAGKGVLLRRLLARFRFAATIPDPLIAIVSEDAREQVGLAPHMRMPWWPLWPGLLRVLARHAAEVATLAPFEGADLCALWLRTMPPKVLGRAEAASLALAIGREVQAASREGLRFVEPAQHRAIYEAVLHAAPDLPVDAGALCLELARRRPESTAVVARAKAHAERTRKEVEARLAALPPQKRNLGLGSPMFPRGKLRKPFADGPAERVDDAFQDAVLNSQGVLSLAAATPDVAREVLLACTLEEPRHEPDDDGLGLMLERFGVEEPRGWFPPMFFRGPWLPMLRQDPGLGIDIIVRIANQATEVWARRMIHPNADARVLAATRAVVHVDGKPVEFVGDLSVFGWYRDRLCSAHLLVSVLMALERWLYEQVDLDRSIDGALARVLETGRSASLLGVLVAVGLYRPALFTGVLAPLLAAWPLYEWDLRLAFDWDLWKMGFFQWSKSGERVFNMVRDFHAMPHRRRLLRDLAVSLMLTDSAARARFEGVRAEWKKLAASEACPAPESLELLVARMDPANYTTTPLDGSRVQVAFEWPEHLKARTEESASRSEADSRVLMFPLECRRLLDAGAPLEAHAAELVWKKTLESAIGSDDEDGETMADRRADAALGGVAVLTILAPEFLAADPEKQTWCNARLQSVADSPPARRLIDTPVSISKDQWHSFVADIAVAGLCTAPDDPEARERAARALTSFWYATTGVALRAAFRRRAELGAEFPRLVNLAVLWAALRRVRSPSEFNEPADALADGRRERLIAGFTRKAVPAAMMDWEEIGAVADRAAIRAHRRRFPGYEPPAQPMPDGNTNAEKPLSPRGVRRRRTRGDPGFDIMLLQHAFSWLPLPAPGHTPAEESDLLAWLRQLMGVTLRMTYSPAAEDEVGGTPYEFDHWVLDVAAKYVGCLTSNDDAHSVFVPILQLGPGCHYWVEGFLNGWTVGALPVAPTPDRFFERWGQMMRFAGDSPKWQPSQGRRHFRLAGLWEHLMGMHLGASIVAADGNQERFRALLTHYERWAGLFLDDDRSLTAYAQFLTHPGARPLLCPSIPWLLRAAERVSPYEWARDPIADEVATVLREAWNSFSEKIGADKALRESFTQLLNLLVTRQSPTAMELRDRVSRVVSLE